MIPENIISVLITGKKPEFESILFQCAIHYAELGLNIWFISPEQFTELPQNIKPPDKEILKLITFLYLKDQKELLARLNEIHLWHKWPQLIILNRYEHYCMMQSTEYARINAAFVTASLLDATSTCASKHSKKKAYLIASCSVPSTEKSEHLNTLCDTYFSTKVTFHNDNTNVNDAVLQIKKYLEEQQNENML